MDQAGGGGGEKWTDQNLLLDKAVNQLMKWIREVGEGKSYQRSTKAHSQLGSSTDTEETTAS